MFWVFWLAKVEVKTSYRSNSMTIIIFPNAVHHYVKSILSHGERVAVYIYFLAKMKCVEYNSPSRFRFIFYNSTIIDINNWDLRYINIPQSSFSCTHVRHIDKWTILNFTLKWSIYRWIVFLTIALLQVRSHVELKQITII